MKLLLVCVMFCVSACATKQPPTSQDFMSTCRSLCKGKVQHYQDDAIDCVCRE